MGDPGGPVALERRGGIQLPELRDVAGLRMHPGSDSIAVQRRRSWQCNLDPMVGSIGVVAQQGRCRLTRHLDWKGCVVLVVYVEDIQIAVVIVVADFESHAVLVRSCRVGLGDPVEGAVPRLMYCWELLKSSTLGRSARRSPLMSAMRGESTHRA
jgi:hypothetical protein